MPASPTSLTRRHFLKAATAAAAAAASLPPAGHAQTAGRPVRPAISSGERLNVACIGVRGPGYGALRECIQTENVVALCDVDNSMMSHGWKVG